MQVTPVRFGLAIALMALLSGCGGGAVFTGPDEFSVLPTKPLQTPASYSSLPEPTPGGTNLTDATPRADAVAALGGNPAALNRAGIPAADRALLAYTSRYGVSPTIREELSGKRRGSLFGGLSAGSRLFSGFRGQVLDAWRELTRLRAAGVKTPSAPPAP